MPTLHSPFSLSVLFVVPTNGYSEGWRLGGLGGVAVVSGGAAGGHNASRTRSESVIVAVSAAAAEAAGGVAACGLGGVAEGERGGVRGVRISIAGGLAGDRQAVVNGAAVGAGVGKEAQRKSVDNRSHIHDNTDSAVAQDFMNHDQTNIPSAWRLVLARADS